VFLSFLENGLHVTLAPRALASFAHADLLLSVALKLCAAGATLVAGLAYLVQPPPLFTAAAAAAVTVATEEVGGAGRGTDLTAPIAGPTVTTARSTTIPTARVGLLSPGATINEVRKVTTPVVQPVISEPKITCITTIVDYKDLKYLNHPPVFVVRNLALKREEAKKKQKNLELEDEARCRLCRSLWCQSQS
jgi:hypothetical protein